MIHAGRPHAASIHSRRHRRFRRGRLWDQASWPGPDALPSMPCILYDQTRGAMSLEALEARNAESLARLY